MEAESLNPWSGSRAGRGANRHREFDAAVGRISSDYFTSILIYNEVQFERRFRLLRSVMHALPQRFASWRMGCLRTPLTNIQMCRTAQHWIL